MPIDAPGQKSVVEFIRDATEGLKWMERELAEATNEGDKAALAGAREELVQMLLQLAGEESGSGWEN